MASPGTSNCSGGRSGPVAWLAPPSRSICSFYWGYVAILLVAPESIAPGQVALLGIVLTLPMVVELFAFARFLNQWNLLGWRF